MDKNKLINDFPIWRILKEVSVITGIDDNELYTDKAKVDLAKQQIIHYDGTSHCSKETMLKALFNLP